MCVSMYLAIALGSRLQIRIALACRDCSDGGGKSGLCIGSVLGAGPNVSAFRLLRIRAGLAIPERRDRVFAKEAGHISNPALGPAVAALDARDNRLINAELIADFLLRHVARQG